MGEEKKKEEKNLFIIQNVYGKGAIITQSFPLKRHEF